MKIFIISVKIKKSKTAHNLKLKVEEFEDKMSLKEEILYELELNRGNVLSGQLLADKYGVSRNAIWKAIKQLKDGGYKIVSGTNSGYMLEKTSDIISAEGIRSCLKDRNQSLIIDFKDKVDSTNNEAKRKLADGETDNFLIVAKEQTAGRGRRGHTFFSPSGGAYLTLVVHPTATLQDTVPITAAAAVAVVEAIEKLTDKKAQIKWVNDIYIDGGKAAGILTEATTGFEEGLVQSVIVGIGLNITPEPVPDELKGKVAFIGNQKATKNELIAETVERLLGFFDNLTDRAFFESYRKHSMILGKEITYIKDGVEDTAEAVDITDDGLLILKLKNGDEKKFRNGEISITV